MIIHHRAWQKEDLPLFLDLQSSAFISHFTYVHKPVIILYEP